MNTLRWIAFLALLFVGQPAIAQDRQNSLDEPQMFEGVPVGVMKPEPPNNASSTIEGGTLKTGEYHITQSWSQENRFQRPFHVSVPESKTASAGKQTPLPVFIFLHGNGGDAKQAMKRFLRNHTKMASRYVMVFPQGYRKSWNIVSERSKADDLGFIESIVQKLSVMENVKSNEFSIMGASNGAALVNQLAIESKLPNIRNYISGVSPLNKWQHDGEHFKSKGADNNYTETANPMVGKRLMNISGTEDNLVPYDGGFSKHIPARNGKLEFVDAEHSTFLWAQQMGYKGAKLVRPTEVDGNLEVFSYLDGDVVHYKVRGQGHGATHEVTEEILLEFLEGARAVTSLVAEASQAPQFIAFDHENVERRYLLHVPQDLPENAPLVFVLHGYRGDARDYTELGMNRLADANRFAVCYPQGADDLEGVPHWNARLKISKTDDIGFLSALASHLQIQHSLNASKTFVCGISNGGFMSYTLVAEKPDVFKAAASVIGAVSGYTWEHRDSIQPVPILQVSSLSDEVVPYDGSMSKAGGWGGAPDQDTVVEFWRKLNKTKTKDVITLSSKTTGHHYQGGVNGNEVWHYKIQELGHRIPSEREMKISAAELIWKFFSKF